MRLSRNNAPEVWDLVATVMVSMMNGATRFRHFDCLRGDAATAGLFGVRRFMSCDSVRRNFASISGGRGTCVGLAREPAPPASSRSSATVRRRTCGTCSRRGGRRGYSASSAPCSRSRGRGSARWRGRTVFARLPAEVMPKRRKRPPQRKFTQLGIPGLELVEASDGDHSDGYEWHALVTDLDMDARDVLPLYRERGDCENVFTRFGGTARTGRRVSPASCATRGRVSSRSTRRQAEGRANTASAGDPSASLSRKNHGETPAQPAN